jgi:hypothetical protein
MWPEAVIVSFLYCFGNYLHILALHLLLY